MRGLKHLGLLPLGSDHVLRHSVGVGGAWASCGASPSESRVVRLRWSTPCAGLVLILIAPSSKLSCRGGSASPPASTNSFADEIRNSAAAAAARTYQAYLCACGCVPQQATVW